MISFKQHFYKLQSLLFDCLDEDASGSVQQNQNLEETFVPRKNYKYLDVKSILQQQQTYNNMKEALGQSRTGSPQPSTTANVLDGNRRSPIVIGPSNRLESLSVRADLIMAMLNWQMLFTIDMLAAILYNCNANIHICMLLYLHIIKFVYYHTRVLLILFGSHLE